MNLRAMPVLLSLIFTLVLLFGGWFTYQQFYVQKPIEAFIKEKSQVTMHDMQINKNQVNLYLDFTNPDTFVNDYKEIREFVATTVPGKSVSIQLSKHGEDMLNLWEEEYFGLAEAIRKQEYSRIPEIIEEMGKKRQLEKTVARMDEQNVYVFLQSGAQHLYAVLPLKEEVKTHE
ncbi:hypothetical protein [Ammoniphilus sp. CFH 90114]|uniref:hypothetical protein n=1 Tax=Ammoniphilus sp. CFH 90114 TaxID=2493665 RepID=UPI00100FFA50|nr:hypothetical protein [Ammoniphilus sp. CFH 90114]RXT13953.1 hypothetical protein EIZ39_07415 [Ammoniphilus sp. CFH 90114]